MTDALDTEIRRLMGELWESAPLPPTADEICRRRPRQPQRGRRWLALVAMLIPVVALAGLLRVGDRSPTRLATGGPPTSELPSAQVGGPGDGVLPDPTFVTLANPPAGLRFIEGGGRVANGRSKEILLADSQGRSARVLWTAPSGCGAGTPATTIRGEPGGASLPSAAASPIPSNSKDAAFVASGNGGAMHWCEQGRMNINLMTSGLDEAGTRGLAMTIRPMAGNADQLTLDVPSGFSAGRPDAHGRLYKLAFRPEENLSSRPRLTLMITSAWSTNMQLLKAKVGGSAVEVDVDGRKGFIVQAPGGPRYQSLVIVYDDRTIVTLDGDGLTPDQLLSAAASLRPADSSLAPDVSGDPGLCDRLGLCG